MHGHSYGIPPVIYLLCNYWLCHRCSLCGRFSRREKEHGKVDDDVKFHLFFCFGPRSLQRQSGRRLSFLFVCSKQMCFKSSKCDLMYWLVRNAVRSKHFSTRSCSVNIRRTEGCQNRSNRQATDYNVS